MIWGYLASLFMGLVMGLIGAGGSILTVPILVYLFSMDPLTATTNSLFIVGGTALFGALLAGRSGHIDVKKGLLFAVPSFVGVSFARRALLPWLPDPVWSSSGLTLSKGSLVLSTFALLMVAASWAMVRGSHSAKKNSSPQPIHIASKGFFVGLVTGFVGAGGGFLIIPSLVLLLGMPMRIAVGTSLAIIAANSLLGFLLSLNTASQDWIQLSLILALGVFGLLIGRLSASRVSDNHLKTMFGYFVLLMGLFILLDQIF